MDEIKDWIKSAKNAVCEESRARAFEGLIGSLDSLTKKNRKDAWLKGSGANDLAFREGVDLAEIESAIENDDHSGACSTHKEGTLGGECKATIGKDDSDKDVDDDWEHVEKHASNASTRKQTPVGATSRYYRDRLKIALDGFTLNRSVVEQIEKDVHRSGVRENMYQILNRILVAYADRNRKIGYAQGMNFLVSRCLREGFAEEEAFWMLAAFVETILPNYFDDSLSGVRVDNEVVMRLLKTHTPNFASVLMLNDIEIQGQVSSMLMTVFENNLPGHSISLVWDLIFLFSFESFGFALILTFVESLEPVLPGAGAESFDIEMTIMQSLQRYRTLSRDEILRFVLPTALEWALIRLPGAKAIRALRSAAKSDVDIHEALLRNPRLALLHAHAEGLRAELALVQSKLTLPLLSSSGTALAARKAMRLKIRAVVDMIGVRFPKLRRRLGARNSSSRMGILERLGETKLAFESEYQLFTFAAFEIEQIVSALTVEMKEAMPLLEKELLALRDGFVDTSTLADPVRQLVTSILASLTTCDR